ncbi:hypothetical protein DOTSEDRAFT_25368 [Dothistroma septosporum NZE10]|uniref:Uncharacterized protein n=1 Tax=Dothistroma septosporum (strain NZE10 / CBS 128990) TaxID=675120 RepID=M2Y5B6_DOTSN|nr:hypothetical protein DOTSEDRAFT_25368 [Dothistroma septosporum NZE10]
MLPQRNSQLHVLYIGALILTLFFFLYQDRRQAEQINNSGRTIADLQTALDTTKQTLASLRSTSHETPQALLHESSFTFHEDNTIDRTAVQSEQSPSPQDLILYSFHETEEATKNFQFFLKHALHAKADFIIMLNGEHIQNLSAIGTLPNVRIVERENHCFDLGGFYEIFQADRTLTTKYKRYMFINASLRGPFFPPWANKVCWSDAYWDQLDEMTKIVGMSWNCANGIPYPPHLQSMVLAFTRETLQELMLPHMKCYEDMHSAVAEGETVIAQRIMAAGYDVFAMESGNDVLHTGNYEGSTLHPYETIFAKTNRDWDDRDRRVIDLLTEHADLEEYSSYDRCI